MSATSENATFLVSVMETKQKVESFLQMVDGLPEKTVLEQHLAVIVHTQQTTINILALQIVKANDTLHKHHIWTS